MSVLSLDNVPLNVPVKIELIKADFENKNRLEEIGFTKNCEIMPVHLSPLGDPTAYCLRGTVIALRKEDAQNVIVRGYDNGRR